MFKKECQAILIPARNENGNSKFLLELPRRSKKAIKFWLLETKIIQNKLDLLNILWKKVFILEYKIHVI